MVVKPSQETMETGMVGESHEWLDSDNGHAMKVSLMQETAQDGNPCKTLNIEASGDNESNINKDITLCMQEDSEWVLMQ